MQLPAAEAAQAAARDAAIRAEACGRRLAAIRGALPATAEDVSVAEAALRQSRMRAARAALRLATVQTRRKTRRPETVAPVVVGEVLDTLDAADGYALASAELIASAAAVDLARSRVYWDYCALGGSCSSFEFDAFVAGVLPLVRLERALIEQAFWELRFTAGSE